MAAFTPRAKAVTIVPMGTLRACFCCLLLTSASLAIGACSGDDDGSSSGETCHCDSGDVCSERPVSCENVACGGGSTATSGGEIDFGPGECDQTDVIASCSCPSGYVAFYRSSYTGDPQEDCESSCDGLGGEYTAR